MKSVRARLHPIFGEGWMRIIISDRIFGRLRYQFTKQPIPQVERFIADDLLQLEDEA